MYLDMNCQKEFFIFVFRFLLNDKTPPFLDSGPKFIPADLGFYPNSMDLFPE